MFSGMVISIIVDPMLVLCVVRMCGGELDGSKGVLHQVIQARRWSKVNKKATLLYTCRLCFPQSPVRAFVAYVKLHTVLLLSEGCCLVILKSGFVENTIGKILHSVLRVRVPCKIFDCARQNQEPA